MASGTPVFSAGTRVVYPNQGVCRVVGQVEMTIGGQSATFLKLARENDDGTVMIPLDKLAGVGVRRLASADEIAELFGQLSAPDLGPDLNWKTRHRSHGERMSEGGVFAMAGVVKELAALADLRPLPVKERELYDNARHLLVSEIAASLGIDEASAEDAVDFALFPPGVERKKLAALALDALSGLADGDDSDLDLDADILADADALDGLEEGGVGEDEGETDGGRGGPLAIDELAAEEAPAPNQPDKKKRRTSARPAVSREASAEPGATALPTAAGKAGAARSTAARRAKGTAQASPSAAASGKAKGAGARGRSARAAAGAEAAAPAQARPNRPKGAAAPKAQAAAPGAAAPTTKKSAPRKGAAKAATAAAKEVKAAAKKKEKPA